MVEMKTFRQFLSNVEREFTYKIKFLDECNDQTLEQLESSLSKFDLTQMSPTPKHLPWHTKPADFDAADGEVFIVEVVTKFPLPQQMKATLAQNCGMPESHVRIISENDPATEIETMISTFGSGDKAKLLDSEYSEQAPIDHDDFYGEGWKNRLMKEMEQAVKMNDTHVSNYMDDDGKNDK